MSGIYFFSILIFLCLFFNGYKKFSLEKSICENKKFLIICAVIFHLLFIALYKKASYITAINFIFNFLSAFIIYNFSKKYCTKKKALICSCFFILNPVFIIYCAAWTKAYSIYIFAVLLMMFLYQSQKKILGHAVFIGALFCSENALFLYPITLAAQLGCHTNKNSPQKNISKSFILNWTAYILLSILTYFIFKYKLQDSLMAYPYASCNAFNFWTALSHNWTNIYNNFLGTSYFNINLAVLICSVIILLVLCKKLNYKENSFLILSFIYASIVFNFALMIHEEFFPLILVILLMLFIVAHSAFYYLMYTAFSVLHFFNLWYTLSIYNPAAFNVNSAFAIIFSLVSVFLSIFCIYYSIANKDLWSSSADLTNTFHDDKNEKCIKYNFMNPLKICWTDHDYICVIALTIIFALLAFFKLGNNFAPQTSYNLYKNKSEIVINLGKETNVDHLSFFAGEFGRVNVNISLFDKGSESWYEINPEDKINSELKWNDIKINKNVQFIKIVPLSDTVDLRELAVCDKDNKVITPVNRNDYKKLFDEQNMHPENNTYLFGTMFDEIYYSRTIYEFLNGLPAYEITHPPLGKIIMTLGVKLFGLNPYGWRFMSVIFGIIMVPLMYVFSKKLFKNKFIPCTCTFLLCFDFIHFTLSRICTIDVFVAFFILLMYYFMYCYIAANFNDVPLKNTLLILFLCGLSTGLAISTKWTGIYAACGLAIIFFASLYFKYIMCSTLPADKENNIENSKDNINESILKFKNNTIKTILFCILSFIIMPLSIYILSYKPVVLKSGNTSLFMKAFNNLKYMLNYHTGITGTHPYSSSWYEWPLIKRPLFDSICRFNDSSLCSTVSTFGNPVIWWTGVICIIYCFYLMIKEKDLKAGFLTVSYLAQLVPWMFVSRYTMIYHYFPCSLFQILIIGYTIEKLCCKYSIDKVKKLTIVYCILAFVSFAAFYPAISGYPVSKNYVHTYLELLDTWTFE